MNELMIQVKNLSLDQTMKYTLHDAMEYPVKLLDRTMMHSMKHAIKHSINQMTNRTQCKTLHIFTPSPSHRRW